MSFKDTIGKGFRTSVLMKTLENNSRILSNTVVGNVENVPKECDDTAKGFQNKVLNMPLGFFSFL